MALELLFQYFQLNDKVDHAAAYITQAKSFLELGEVPKALTAYEAALHEVDFPNLKTRAYVEYPYRIAVRNISSHYKRALEVLAQRRLDVTFPADHFMWHAAGAMILSAIMLLVEFTVVPQLRGLS